MTGLRELWLLGLAAYHRWRAERDLDAGKAHHMLAIECELEAEVLKQNRSR